MFIAIGRAANPEQGRLSEIRQEAAFLFLLLMILTDYQAMLGKGIHFVRPPAREEYGTVAVFEDLYGNLWDLIEPASKI
jgi:hypothetical protein